MVSVKASGFLSGIYVKLHLITLVLFASLWFSVIVIDSKDITSVIPFLVFLAFLCLLFYIRFYVPSPYAYKRFVINSSGIKVDDMEMKFENIKTITIERGYIFEWFGFKFIEKVTGIIQHEEIYLEEMICINGGFEGFKKKKIYVPMTKETDKAMRTYCDAYAPVANRFASEGRGFITLNKKHEILKIIIMFIAAAIAAAIMIACSVSGIFSVYKAIIVWALIVLNMFVILFKNFVASLLYKRIGVK